jgi:chaperonin GroES
MSGALHPLSDYVVAQADEAETKTASGLYLPEKSAEKPKTSRVIAVGPDVKQVKVGDRIVYRRVHPGQRRRYFSDCCLTQV